MFEESWWYEKQDEIQSIVEKVGLPLWIVPVLKVYFENAYLYGVYTQLHYYEKTKD